MLHRKAEKHNMKKQWAQKLYWVGKIHWPPGVVSFLYQVMRIVDNVRPDRQTVMFSATFPRAMEALARRILAKPIEVQVGGRSVVCSDVEQHVVNHLCFISLIEKGLFKGHIRFSFCPF